MYVNVANKKLQINHVVFMYSKCCSSNPGACSVSNHSIANAAKFASPFIKKIDDAINLKETFQTS